MLKRYLIIILKITINITPREKKNREKFIGTFLKNVFVNMKATENCMVRGVMRKKVGIEILT